MKINLLITYMFFYNAWYQNINNKTNIQPIQSVAESFDLVMDKHTANLSTSARHWHSVKSVSGCMSSQPIRGHGWHWVHQLENFIMYSFEGICTVKTSMPLEALQHHSVANSSTREVKSTGTIIRGRLISCTRWNTIQTLNLYDYEQVCHT